MDANLLRDFQTEMIILKYIPLILAVLQFTFIILLLFPIDLILLSSMGGIGFIPLIFLYISSYVFRFCKWHRMSLHYITLVLIICLIDYYFMLPISLTCLLTIHILLFIALIVSIIYFKLKENEYI